MPAVPSPLRRRSPSRTTAVTGAVAAAGLALIAAVPASADTARIVGIPESALAGSGVTITDADEPEPKPAARPPRDARVVLTGADGPSRRLGPFRLPGEVGAVTASPDGQHLLLTTFGAGREDLDIDLYVVAVAGGAPKRLALPAGAVPISLWGAFTGSLSPASFSTDGTEVVLGDIAVISPDADEGRSRPGDLAYRSYRCVLATAACGPVGADGAGTAVAFPGGVLTSSSLFSGLAKVLPGVVDPTDTWEARGSRGAAALAKVPGTTVRSTIEVSGATPRIVSDVRHTLRDGVPLTLTALGGPSGALLTRITGRYALQRGRKGVRLRSTTTGPRLTMVRPDGTSTTGPVPRVTVSRSALRRVDRRYRTAKVSVPFTPVLDRGDGGWLGVAGDPTFTLEDVARDSHKTAEAVVLSTLDGAGIARAVRVGGRDATAETLLRYVPKAGVVRSTLALSVVGYERATRTAVIRVQWQAGRKGDRARSMPRSAALRVPLDGTGRPTVLTGGVQTAW